MAIVSEGICLVMYLLRFRPFHLQRIEPTTSTPKCSTQRMKHSFLHGASGEGPSFARSPGAAIAAAQDAFTGARFAAAHAEGTTCASLGSVGKGSVGCSWRSEEQLADWPE